MNRFEGFTSWELMQIRKALVMQYTQTGTDFEGEQYCWDEWLDSGMQKCVQEITEELNKR